MTRRSFETWLEAYGQAWETRNPTAAGALYADGASYQETPFTEPLRGRKAIEAYWTHVAQTQEQIRFRFKILAVTDTLGIAQWHATFLRPPARVPLELDGIFLISLNRENRCTALREWWHRREGIPHPSGKPRGRLEQDG